MSKRPDFGLFVVYEILTLMTHGSDTKYSERGHMSMRKEIMASWKKRTLALVLALTTILTTSNADLTALVSGVGEVEAAEDAYLEGGGTFGEAFVAGSSGALTNGSFSVYTEDAATISAEAWVYRNFSHGPLDGTEYIEGGVGTRVWTGNISTTGSGYKDVSFSLSNLEVQESENYSVVVTLNTAETVLVKGIGDGFGYCGPTFTGSSYITTTIENTTHQGGVTGISFNGDVETGASIQVGSTVNLTAEISPALYRTVQFETSDSSIISLSTTSGATDTDGRVNVTATASAPGTATLTAKYISYTGAAQTATVTYNVYTAATVNMKDDSIIFGTLTDNKVPVVINSTDCTESNENFNIAYSNNTSVGTASVTVTGKAGGTYAGFSEELTYEIIPRDISGNALNSKITLNNLQTSGAEVTGGIAVTDDVDNPMSLGTDYTATATQISVNGTQGVQYRVTINGIGNYEGTSNEFELWDAGSLSQKDISKFYKIRFKNNSSTFIWGGENVELDVDRGDIVFLDKGNDSEITGSALTELKNNVSISIANGGVIGETSVVITATGGAGYTGTITAPISIKKNSLTTNTRPSKDSVRGLIYISGIEASYAYTGSAVTIPDLKVEVNKQGGSTYRDLVKDTDYTLEYSNNIEMGTATVRIVGKGNFTGSVTKTFEISGTFAKDSVVSIAGTDYAVTTYSPATKKGNITSNYSVEYTGSEVSVPVEVVFGSETLTENTNYTVTYEKEDGSADDHKNAGTHTLKITGLGTYAENVIYVTFTITPHDISGETLTITSAGNKHVYTPATGGVTLTAGRDRDYYITASGYPALTEGADFTADFTNNTEAGSATITLTGRGNYTGTLSKNYTIKKLELSSCTVTVAPGSVPYTGSAYTHGNGITVTVTDGSGNAIPEENYTLTYNNNVSQGTAVVTVTAVAGKNLSGVKTASFVIGKKLLTSSTSNITYALKISASAPVTREQPVINVTPSEDKDVAGTGTAGNDILGLEYNGRERQPYVVVRDGSTVLTPNTDYAITGYTNAVNAGTATVTVEGRGNYEGTMEINYTIDPYNISNNGNIVLTATAPTRTSESDPWKATVKVEDSRALVPSGSRTLVPEAQYTSGATQGGFTITMTDGFGEYDGQTDRYLLTVSVEGSGNYTGTKSAVFPMGTDISTAQVKIAGTVYDGTNPVEIDYIKNAYPAIEVYINPNTLELTTDYTVAYEVVSGDSSDIYAAGNRVRATITAANRSKKYFGTKTVEYAIQKKTLTGVTLKWAKDAGDYWSDHTGNGTTSLRYIYDGESVDILDPTQVKVMMGTEELTNGVDYYISKIYPAGTAGGTSSTYTSSNHLNRYVYASDGNVAADMAFEISAMPNGSYEDPTGTPQLFTLGNSKYFMTQSDTTAMSVYTTQEALITDLAAAGNRIRYTALRDVVYPGTDGGLSESTFTLFVFDTAIIDTRNAYGYKILAKDTDIHWNCLLDGKNASDVTTIINSTTMTESEKETAFNALLAEHFLSLSDPTQHNTIIRGTGTNYSGFFLIPYNVVKRTITESMVTGAPTSLSYKNAEWTPTQIETGMEVKYDANTTLTKGADYTVTYDPSPVRDAGSYTMTITGAGNYTGTVTKTFTVAQKELSSNDGCGSIELSRYSYIFDQGEHSPEQESPQLKVYDGEGNELTKGLDYTVKYFRGNTEMTAGNEDFETPGTITVKVYGKGDSGQYFSTPAGKELTASYTIKGDISNTAHFTSTQKNVTELGLTPSGAIDELGKLTNEISYTTSDGQSHTLTAGTDYTWSVTDARGNTVTSATPDATGLTAGVNAGTITLTGTGDYTGTIQVRNVSLKASTNGDFYVIMSTNQFDYTGSAITPDTYVQVRYNDATGQVLRNNTDYELSYTDNTNVGRATVNVTGKGSYDGITAKDGSCDDTFIIRYNFNNAIVTTNGTSFTYDGSAKTPTITNITVAGKSITKPDNNTQTSVSETIAGVSTELYTINRPNSTDIGTYTLSLDGKAPYAYGSADVSYSIGAISLADATITMDPVNYDYTGNEITPTVTVTLAGQTVDPANYRVTYRNNVDANLDANDDPRSGYGTPTVTVTAAPNGNYTGSKSATFNIRPRNISDETAVSIDFGTVYFAAGAVLSPPATVKNIIKDATLRNGSDYTVTYPGDMGTISDRDYTVTVNGIGNYKGSKAVTVHISPVSLNSASISISENSSMYTGKPITPTITVTCPVAGTGAVQPLRPGTDYEIQGASSFTNVGDYTITIAGKADSGFTDTRTVPFAVTKRDFGVDYATSQEEGKTLGTDYILKFEVADADYTGSSVTPAVTITNYKMGVGEAGRTLVENGDFTVTYENNINAAAATSANPPVAVITGIGDNFMGTCRVPFNIGTSMETLDPVVTLDATGFNNATNNGYIYDRRSHTPSVLSVTATINGNPVTLVEGQDYSVDYAGEASDGSLNNDTTNVGTKYVLITGMGSYYGTKARADLDTYTIDKRVLSHNTDAEITLDLPYTVVNGVKQYYTYYAGRDASTGDSIPITPTVTVKDKTLNSRNPVIIDASEYDLSFRNNSDISTSTNKAMIDILLNGSGNYEACADNGGSSVNLTAEFEIRQIEVSEDAGFAVALLDGGGNGRYEYDPDDPITPTVSLTDGNGRELVENVDYTVEFSNSTADPEDNTPGVHTATITGIGNYSGSGLTKSYTVYADLAKEESTGGYVVVDVPEQYYTGIRPDDDDMKEAITVEIVNGDGDVVATLTPDVDYTVEFEYSPAVDSGWVTITGTGSASDGIYIGQLSDYPITFDTDMGSAYIATPSDPIQYLYSGYPIALAEQDDFVVKTTAHNQEYAIDPDDAVYYRPDDTDGEEGIADFDGHTRWVETNDLTSAGPIWMKLTFTLPTPGATPTTLTAGYTIEKRLISANDDGHISINMDDYDYYHNAECKPEPVIIYNNKRLVKGTDYSLTYSNNINPGTATVTIEGLGNFAGTKPVSFAIRVPKLLGLTATAASETQVNLSWNPNRYVTGYKVYTEGGSLVGQTTGTAYSVNSLTSGTKYTFRVVPYVTAGGVTTDGEPISASAVTPLATPTATATSSGSGTATIAFPSTANNVSYDIFRSTSETGSYRLVATIPAPRTNFENTGLAAGTYYYKIRMNKKVDGVWYSSGLSSPVAVNVH